MTKQTSLIGTELDCTIRTIELSQVTRLDGLNHMLAADKSHDKSLGTQHNSLFWLGNLINIPKIYKVLGLSINNVLHSRETVIHHGAITPGDKVAVRTYLRDAYEQQASNNPIGFVILESVGLLNNDLIFYSERIIAVRGGFSRGRSS